MTNNDIIKELDLIKDDVKFYVSAVDMFYDIQLTHGPLIEVITIIRFEKPKLYAFLKTRFDKNPRFKMLFEVIVDYEFARKSLGFDITYISPSDLP